MNLLTRSLLLGIAVVLAASAQAQQTAKSPTAATSRILNLDSTLLDLLEDTRTRPVIEKHLPNLAQRVLVDEDVARMLGSSTLRELAVDPHVRGFTDDVLKKLEAELAQAQQAN